MNEVNKAARALYAALANIQDLTSINVDNIIDRLEEDLNTIEQDITGE